MTGPAMSPTMPSPTSLADDLALLVEAAREAGQIARRFWRQSPRAWDKGGGAGPVTEADLAVNVALMARLTTARPTYGWLSEESEDEPARLDAKRVFIVDPIDGTRAFIDGQEGFSHALAVVEGDRVVAGAVYLPIPDLMYTAHAGGPALLNGRVLTPSAVDRPEDARVLTNKAALDPVFWRGGQPPPFRRDFRPSLAWRLCLVAEGRFDAVLSLRGAWEWDIAAGTLIAERAGCEVSDMRGQPLRFNNARPMVDGLVVAPPPLHATLIGALDRDSATAG